VLFQFLLEVELVTGYIRMSEYLVFRLVGE
jgi:hypothetical protein